VAPVFDLHSFPTRRSSDLSAFSGARDHRQEHDIALTALKIGGISTPQVTRSPFLVGDCIAELAFDQFSLARSHQRNNAHGATLRSEEHTSELQSRFDLVCR